MTERDGILQADGLTRRCRAVDIATFWPLKPAKLLSEVEHTHAQP